MSKTQEHKGPGQRPKRTAQHTHKREKEKEQEPQSQRQPGRRGGVGGDPPKTAERQHKQREQRDRRETTAARQKETREGRDLGKGSGRGRYRTGQTATDPTDLIRTKQAPLGSLLERCN